MICMVTQISTKTHFQQNWIFDLTSSFDVIAHISQMREVMITDLPSLWYEKQCGYSNFLVVGLVCNEANINLAAIKVTCLHRRGTSINTWWNSGSAYIFIPPWQFTGPWFNIKMSSYQYRKSHCGDLISTMGFPILVRCHLYIESGPCCLFRQVKISIIPIFLIPIQGNCCWRGDTIQNHWQQPIFRLTGY